MAVRDLINAAMMDIGVLAAGEVASSSEQNDAFSALNNLLDSYSTEKLVIFTETSEQFPLIGGQQSYTMGVGGNFSTARAQSIDRAGLFVPGTGGTLGVEIPIEIITYNEWAAIEVKAITSSIPTKLYNDANNPLSNLYFWPLPGAANFVNLYSTKALTEFVNLSTIVGFPPGYNRMLQKGLAIEIAPSYGKEPSPALVAQYREAKGNVKRMNKTPRYLGTDAALLGRRAGFNWLKGDTVR